MEDDDDLKSYWRDRKQRTPEDWTVRESLECAAEKASGEVLGEFTHLLGQPVDHAVVSEIATKSIIAFMGAWFEELRRANFAAVIDVVLEGQKTPLPELKGFVRALPLSLIERVIYRGGLSRAHSGLQALLCIEKFHREKGGKDYDLLRDFDGVLVVQTFPEKLKGAALTFRLDEKFEIGPERAV